MCRKVGILGGSFDPIHKGHLHIAIAAKNEFSLDAVIFIPAGHSPNKDEHKMTPAEHRARMTELAIREYPGFYLSRMEIDSQETSYTYLTLGRLKEMHPDWELYFIMGADSLDYFDKWYHPEIICEKAAVLVAVRDDLKHQEICDKIAEIKALFPARIYPLKVDGLSVSSSEIRKALKEGEAQALLPETVTDYIIEHQLYQTEGCRWN